jgi:hypothetical protein
VKSLTLIFFLLFLSGGAILGSDQMIKEEEDLQALLPKNISGWQAKDPDVLYDPETIFDYIDGAGEIYRAYNFRHLLVRQYTKDENPRIIADLFDMGISKNAYGVFTHDLEGENVGIGRDSTYKGGLLSFWKGRFFVSLYAEEETEESKKALLFLGKRIASAIKQEGDLPVLVSIFPYENLREKRIRFFYNHLILNYHFFVADQNLLLLGQETEAALADYAEGNEIFHVLLVRYSSEETAIEAYEGFSETYMPEAENSGILQTENGKWTAVRLKDNLLVIVFDGLSEAHAKKMIQRILWRDKQDMTTKGKVNG